MSENLEERARVVVRCAGLLPFDDEETMRAVLAFAREERARVLEAEADYMERYMEAPTSVSACLRARAALEREERP